MCPPRAAAWAYISSQPSLTAVAGMLKTVGLDTARSGLFGSTLVLPTNEAVANYTPQILGDVRPYPEIFANFLTKLLNYHFILRSAPAWQLDTIALSTRLRPPPPHSPGPPLPELPDVSNSCMDCEPQFLREYIIYYCREQGILPGFVIPVDFTCVCDICVDAIQYSSPVPGLVNTNTGFLSCDIALQLTEFVVVAAEPRRCPGPLQMTF